MMTFEVGDVVNLAKQPSGSGNPVGRVIKKVTLGEQKFVHVLMQNGSLEFNTVNTYRKHTKVAEDFFAIGMEVEIQASSPKANAQKNGDIGKITSRFRGGTYRVLFSNGEMFHFKEVDMTPIRPRGSLEELKEVEERYANIQDRAKQDDSPDASFSNSSFKFMKGDIVRIKDTSNIKKRQPNRLNQLGTITKVPQHPDTWFKVQFDDKESDGFRSYSLDFVRRGDETEDSSSITTRSKGKELSSSRTDDSDTEPMRVKITYGSHIDKTGVMIGYAPGYIVIKVDELNEKGETVPLTVHKRRDHIEALTDSARVYLTSVRGSTDKRGRKANRATKRTGRGKRKGGRAKAKANASTNPIVAKLLRKKVAVIETGLVGKVVYYDGKKDTYTIRLNDNNSHNLRLMEASQTELDISCKLKLKHNEIMLWEEYKELHGIEDEKDQLTRQSGVQFEPDEQNSSRTKSNTSSVTSQRSSNLLAQLQKSMKFRRSALNQFIKFYREREAKAMPFRPDLTKILKKFNHEIESDLAVFDDANAITDPELVHSNAPKVNEILVTIGDVSTSSILNQKKKTDAVIIDRRDRGKYPLFYNPPLCAICGMEKFKPRGICWNRVCASSPFADKKIKETNSTVSELVDAYNYNKRFKVNSMIKYSKKKTEIIKLEEPNQKTKLKRKLETAFTDENGYFGIGWTPKLQELDFKPKNPNFDSEIASGSPTNIFAEKTEDFEKKWDAWIET